MLTAPTVGMDAAVIMVRPKANDLREVLRPDGHQDQLHTSGF